MRYFRVLGTNKWLFAVVPLLLLLALACGAADTPTPVVIEKEVIKEVEVVKELVVPLANPAFVGELKPAWVDRGKQGGFINFVGRGNAGFWDVHYSSSLSASLTPSGPQFSQLVMYNPVSPNEIIGDLAESWSISEDGRTYTFRLHDAKWSDGQPVTADDIKFTFDRIVEEGAKRGRVTALRLTYEHGSATVVDDKTLVVPLRFASATFLTHLATDYHKMYARHIVEGVSQEDLNCCPENNLGSGPWIFKEWVRQESFTYEKNQNYFKPGRPFFDGYKLFLIPDVARAISAMQVGQAHGTFYPAVSTYKPVDMVQLEKDTGGKMRALFLENAQYGQFLFNTTVKPFDDPRVRRAIYLAIDRDEVGERAYRGFYSPGTFFQPVSGVEDLDDLAKQPGFRKPKDQDIAEAKKLLAAAGYPEGFKVNVNTGRSAPALEVLAPQLRDALNIDMTFVPQDTPGWYTALTEGTHPVSFGGALGLTLGDPSDVLANIMVKDVIRNPHNYQDPELTPLIEAQDKELDPVKRMAIFRQMVDIMRKGEGHYMPIVWFHAGGALDYRIKNYYLPATIQLVHYWDHAWWDPDAVVPEVGTGYSP